MRLWPNRLKEQSLDDRNLRLILDESSAAMPWEMMDDRRPWTVAGGGDGKDNFGPPVTRFGVIRQLMAMNFRRTTPKVNGNKALVIGDPRGEASGLSELPGAQAEAKEVAAALEARDEPQRGGANQRTKHGLRREPGVRDAPDLFDALSHRAST